jgi:predicted Zn-dependent protease
VGAHRRELDVIDQAQIDDVAARALAAAGRRDAEVAVLAYGRHTATLDPGGFLEQAFERSIRVRFRVVRGTAERCAQTQIADGLDDTAFAETLAHLDEALDNQAYSSATPGLLHPGMMSSAAPSTIAGPDSRTAQSSPAHLVDFAARALLAARDAGVSVSGSYSIELGGCDDREPIVRLANTWGLDRAFTGARVHANFRFFADNGFAERVDRVSYRRGDLEPDLLFAAAAQRARNGRLTAAAPAHGAPLLLEPAAVALLASTYASLLDEAAILDGRSPFRFGSTEQVAALGATIAFDPNDARNPGRAFDGEGVPSRRLELVRSGQIGELARSREQAERSGDDAPGYSPLQPSLRPYRLRGALFEADSTDDWDDAFEGLVIAELGAVRLVDPRRGVAHALVTRGWVRTAGEEHALQAGQTARVTLPDLFRSLSAAGRAVAIPAGVYCPVRIDNSASAFAWL